MFSFLLLSQVRCCRSRLRNGYGLTTTTATRLAQQTPYCSDNTADDGGDGDDDQHVTSVKRKRASALGQSVIMVQQGTDIQELPIVLRRYGPNDAVAFSANESQMNRLASTDDAKANGSDDDVDRTPHVIVNPGAIDDNKSVLNVLEKCASSSSILRIIDAMAESELQPPDVLAAALDKIMRIETVDGLKTLEVSNESYHLLIEWFCNQCDTQALLGMLNQLSKMLFMNQTIDRICEEILIRNADTKLTIVEICKSIEHFVACKRYDGAEKFWSGIADQEATIDAQNIKYLFEVLPMLKVSRRTVVRILDRVIVDISPLLKADAICDILLALKDCRGDHTDSIMKSISCWLNTCIHSVNEMQLESIVHCLTALPYSDRNIERALERCMKANAIKINAQTLIVEVARHVTVFRLLNAHILNGCCEFFIANADRIDPGNVRDILRPFGLLHFQPLSSIPFWHAIEQYLEVNFERIPPSHAIDVMLTAIVLEMFPVNFTERIFNRRFMHRLHSTEPMNRLPATQSNLQLIDTAMTLECNMYRGPILPPDCHDTMLAKDNRIQCLLSDYNDIIAMVAGGEDAFTKRTMPQSLPYNDLYVIDVLFHPTGLTSNLWSFFDKNSSGDRNVYVAALIHLREHYDSSQEYLIGSQKMRIRHLRRIGLKVVSLNYEQLARLGTHREEVRHYFVEQMKKALPALEPINSNE